MGVDARFFHLYLEHVVAPDLTLLRDRRTALFIPSLATSPRRIILGVLGALAYAHSRGVTHNDIKPGNVLFDDGRGVVVCDWGLATIASNHGRAVCPQDKTARLIASHLAGTHSYLCPEASEGTLPEPSRDIFALGVVALWLFGRIPLPETLKEYRFKIRALDIADGPDMRARGAWLDFLGRSARTLDDRDPYQRLTRQMLASSPQDRPTASRMYQELLRFDRTMAEQPSAAA
jgi:serine/threonine protein kinase